MKPNLDDVVQMISLDRILPDPDQPRKFFDEAEELRIAARIQKYGLIQPILVRPVKHSGYDYRIVHGERRYRAHKRLGLETIKALARAEAVPIRRCIDSLARGHPYHSARTWDCEKSGI